MIGSFIPFREATTRDRTTAAIPRVDPTPTAFEAALGGDGANPFRSPLAAFVLTAS
jgi:hypothetical protein